jgi:hypothetical protein
MKKGIRSALVATTAAGATIVPGAGAAFADSAPQPSAAYPGGAVVGGDAGYTAVVRIAYTCTTDVTPGNHLFVALKEGPNISPEQPTADNSTTAFLSTNWNTDSGPNALNCDGKRHVQQIHLQPQPGTVYGPLVNGPALVQICVYDNITGMNGHEPTGGYAGSYTIQRVVVSHNPA